MLLNLKLIARTYPETPVVWDKTGIIIKEILEKEFGISKNKKWTYGFLLHTIARLGGFIGRKSDGYPGWITIWRSFTQLMDKAEGYKLAIIGKDKKNVGNDKSSNEGN